MKFYRCNNCGYDLNSDIAPASCPNCLSTDLIDAPLLNIESGMQIAGFKLIERIGQGGMSDVWLADQLPCPA